MADKILLVDDEAALLLLVRRVLQRGGLAPETACSGQQAIELLDKVDYDLVIVDLGMPGMDGFEVLEWIRKKRPEIVTLVLSGTTLMEDVIKAMQRGAFDFVTKPIEEYDVFIEQVRRALAHKDLQDSHARLLREIGETNIELENRLGQLELAHSILQSQAMAIQADLNRARNIQQGLLPHELPFWDKVSLAAYYDPANKVGGDFYEVFPLDERRLGLYIADTTGHGVSSALITMFLKYSVKPFEEDGTGKRRIVPPGQLLRALNKLLFEQPFGSDLFISMVYLVLDTETGELQYANAGHPPVLLRHADGRVDELRTPAPALGINPKVKYSTAAGRLEPNDTLVLFSDGITDVQDGTGEFYGRDRLRQTVSQAQGAAAPLAKAIENSVLCFSGPVPMFDDATAIALQFAAQDRPAIARSPEPEAPEEAGAKTATGITAASEQNCLSISVAGSGTWRESQQLIEFCQEARCRGNHMLVLDFTHCVHLDSTFLGVLHTLCAEAEDSESCHVQLQNLSRALLSEMSELGLTSVLLHFRPRPRPLPDSMAQFKPRGQLAETEMGQVLLRAHEALVKADPKNADRFAAVLEILHQQAGRKRQPTAVSSADGEGGADCVSP